MTDTKTGYPPATRWNAIISTSLSASSPQRIRIGKSKSGPPVDIYVDEETASFLELLRASKMAHRAARAIGHQDAQDEFKAIESSTRNQMRPINAAFRHLAHQLYQKKDIAKANAILGFWLRLHAKT